MKIIIVAADVVVVVVVVNVGFCCRFIVVVVIVNLPSHVRRRLIQHVCTHCCEAGWMGLSFAAIAGAE